MLEKPVSLPAKRCPIGKLPDVAIHLPPFIASYCEAIIYHYRLMIARIVEGAIQKTKAPADEPDGSPAEALAKVGGGAGNRTRVRRSYTKGVYMLKPVFILGTQSSTGRDIRATILLKFRRGATGLPLGYPTKMTILPPPWERVGESLAGY